MSHSICIRTSYDRTYTCHRCHRRQMRTTFTRRLPVEKVYNENPVEVAKMFEAHGIRRLHVVDLDGAASKHIVNYKVLEALAGQTSLTIDFGGGIKSDEDLHIAFESGAQMVTLGSIAVKEPDTFSRWMEAYGSERIILGADAKDGKSP